MILKDGSGVTYTSTAERFAQDYLDADGGDRTRRIAATNVLAALWHAIGHIFFPWGSRNWVDHETLNAEVRAKQNTSFPQK